MSQVSISQSENAETSAGDEGHDSAPVSLKQILVALDASDHADRALTEAARLSASADGIITGIHAYAAKLHDRRFRQMEGGLPERYRKEEELEHQREVHDDLITRGLSVISDSYHDAGSAACDKAGVAYRRLSPEGKNYRQIADAAASGDFDVLALGAHGLGVVSGGIIGSVCERVVRRCPVDVLVIRDPSRALDYGPLVVGVDGSPRSFGALKTAFDLGRRLGVAVHAVAAYDPYFHYVAFKKIAGVLSEEASEVFRFKEQEKLHEELIDDGLAKIYQSHLDIARSIAEEEGEEPVCALLVGKPYRAIADYLKKVEAGLLLIGRTGIHADSELDIGGNAENLLRLAPCHVWLGAVEATPPLDAVVRETITWTPEAEEHIARVPETARHMVRMAIVRHAQETGHTVITESLIDEATRMFCPAHGKPGGPQAENALDWSGEAERLVDNEPDPSYRAGIRLRAEKHARRDGASTVRPEHVEPFLDAAREHRHSWTAAALARLARVPEMVRAGTKERIDDIALQRGVTEITLDIAEAGITESREAMQSAMAAGGHKAGTEEES